MSSVLTTTTNPSSNETSPTFLPFNSSNPRLVRTFSPVHTFLQISLTLYTQCKSLILKKIHPRWHSYASPCGERVCLFSRASRRVSYTSPRHSLASPPSYYRKLLYQVGDGNAMNYAALCLAFVAGRVGRIGIWYTVRSDHELLELVKG